MEKPQIRALTPVLLLIGLLAGLMFGRLTLETTSAQLTAERTTPERWEYCAITDIWATGRGGQVIGSANICYFQRSGCRREVVEGVANSTADGSDFTNAHIDALTKAAAKLGGEGWELLGEGTRYFSDGATDRKVLYFRRRQK